MSKANSLSVYSSNLIRSLLSSVALVGFGGAFAACAAENSGGAATPQEQLDTNPTSAGSAQASRASGGGGDFPSCPCGFLKNPLRGTITTTEEGSVSVRVDELLGATADLQVGSEITGTWYGDLPCFMGCASVAAGDEVLAFYTPPVPCVDTSGDDCASGDTSLGSIALAPWGDAVVLASTSRDLTVAVSDLALLDAPFAECTAGLGNISDFLGPDDVRSSCVEP